METTSPQHDEFLRDLAGVINKHSREGGSNTPDFILAEYLSRALVGFERASKHREQWYGKSLSIGMADAPVSASPAHGGRIMSLRECMEAEEPPTIDLHVLGKITLFMLNRGQGLDPEVGSLTAAMDAIDDLITQVKDLSENISVDNGGKWFDETSETDHIGNIAAYIGGLEAERDNLLARSSTTPAMTLDRAREIMKGEIQKDGGLYNLGHYLAWIPGESTICLDCNFDAEELEAIVTIMKADAQRSATTTHPDSNRTDRQR